jgi:hypothetical protein
VSVRVSWAPSWGSPWSPAPYRKQCHGCGERDRVMRVGGGGHSLIRLCASCHEEHRVLMAAEDARAERDEVLHDVAHWWAREAA